MERYIAKCYKRLKEMGVPLKDWHCVKVIDTEDASYTCELCDCRKVRFVHVMAHDDHFEEFDVGCICAGVMEGDILAAKDRERKMKNRANRKKTFMKKEWEMTRTGNYYLQYRNRNIFINCNGVGYYCVIDSRYLFEYKDEKIKDFISACSAVFDFVDPIDEVLL